jgi:hypothetical protein
VSRATKLDDVCFCNTGHLREEQKMTLEHRGRALTGTVLLLAVGFLCLDAARANGKDLGDVAFREAVEARGTVEGPDRAAALFGIWLGEKPLSDSLKAQLLARR